MSTINNLVCGLGGSHRRQLYASRFMRPPGFFKRAKLREKPRLLTGAYENPVKKFVRIREKARQFTEIPPPRVVPKNKTAKNTKLQSISGVPKLAAVVIERRLEFLLSDLAVKQQLCEPLVAGSTPYGVERNAWERQMRDLRKIYRAQYLQKLHEVTEEEKLKQDALFKQTLAERKRLKEEKIERLTLDRKRRAILQERKRIELKISESINTYRNSVHMRKLTLSLQKIEKKLNLVDDPDKLKEIVENSPVLNRKSISVPLLSRQLGLCKEMSSFVDQRATNVFRDLLIESYAILPEDEPQFDPPPNETSPGVLSHRQRAKLAYGTFTTEEKLELLEIKKKMLDDQIDKLQTSINKVDPQKVQLRDFISAAIVSLKEETVKEEQRSRYKEERQKSLDEVTNALDKKVKSHRQITK
eukprot:GHVL01013453.1.p1 GENE.GHVL01013453.1~~GHVL01013453.1.p1  ORF type:complete len:415 (+),score=74.82 GHVL01013453.1:34-1278(+)